MGRGRIFAIAVFASPMLFGCNTPPGCGPVSSSTGGWSVQCDGMASIRDNSTFWTPEADQVPPLQWKTATRTLEL